MDNYLTREEFRESVFRRDNYKCVFCGAKAEDAHHIIERRLFGPPSFGYYVDNGASVCENCHLKCEKTDYSVEEVRKACGIEKVVIPDHLYNDPEYPIDKWGNTILPDGRRLKGELFYDESVQKVIKDKLDLFNNYVKYPRSMHLPWSASVRKDDRIISTLEHLENREVIVTEKVDGECSSLYKDFYHARSLHNRRHPSRDWLKNFHAQIAHNIPDGWRICGENMFGKHSIYYDNLDSYFYGFSIWNEKNECLSWDDTIEYFELLGIIWPKILYRGVFDKNLIHSSWTNTLSEDKSEGYVVRSTEKFSMKDFKYNLAKYVRANHVQTEKHWMFGQKMEVNKLRKD